MFTQALTTTPHLSSSGLSGMVYEHLSRCFIPKDPSSRLLELFLKWRDKWRHFRNIYPPISLEYRPLEAVKPSLSISKPSSTPGTCEAILFNIRTFLGLHPNWVMMQVDINNIFNSVFQVVILESYVMLMGFWWASSLYQVILWCSFFSLPPTWATCGGGHHY